MELVLKLKPEEELRVRKEADSSGMGVNEYALLRLLGGTSSVVGQSEHALRKLDELAVRNQDEKTEVRTILLDPKAAASIALMQSWLEEDATDDPEELRIAAQDLLEFKRNMNIPRKEAGARLHYPEAE